MARRSQALGRDLLLLFTKYHVVKLPSNRLVLSSTLASEAFCLQWLAVTVRLITGQSVQKKSTECSFIPNGTSISNTCPPHPQGLETSQKRGQEA